MKKKNYIFLVAIIAIMICLVSGVIYVFGKNLDTTQNHYLNKINANEIKTINMNKEIVAIKKN